MPYDVYEDPEIWGDASANFPLTVKFTVFGDRVRGVVVKIDRWDPPARKPDERPKPIPKYTLAECTVSQMGHQSKVDSAEILAGQVNLQGQLLTFKPHLGDELDITYTSDGKKGTSGFASKVFDVVVTPPDGQPVRSEPEPTPLRAVGDDDLFDRR